MLNNQLQFESSCLHAATASSTELGCLALCRRPSRNLAPPHSVFSPSPPSPVALVAPSSSSSLSHSHSYISTVSTSPQALSPMTSSPSCKTSHHQKAAHTHPGSTRGTNARNSFRSSTQTCPSHRVEKAGIFVFRTRYLVRVTRFALPPSA
jgi:hypothetical protein